MKKNHDLYIVLWKNKISQLVMDDKLILVNEFVNTCYCLLIFNESILSDATLIALVHCYGKSLRLLILWSSENNIDWLLHNMRRLEYGLNQLYPYIKQAGAETVFKEVFNLIDSENHGHKKIDETLISKYNKESKSGMINVVGDVGIITGTMLAAAGLLVGRKGLSLFTTLLSAQVTIRVLTYIISESIKKQTIKNRKDFYETQFGIVKRDVVFNKNKTLVV